jgi:hypothetical protein
VKAGRGIGEGSTTGRPEGVQAADVNAGSPASAPVHADLIEAAIESVQTGRPVRPEEVEKR